MRRPLIIFVLGTVVAASVSEVAQARDITILNAGFEEPVLDDGTWVTGGPDWEFGIYFADDRSFWFDGAEGSGTDGGIWNPNLDIGFTDEAYAGENVGWAFSQIDIDAGLSQMLEDKLQANTQYHLQVQVGNPLYNQTDFTADYRIELLAGDVLLASDTGESPEADSWELHSLTYNSGPNPAQEGEPLGIRLIAVEYDVCVDGGCEVDFDDVTLTATGGRALAAGDADQDYDFDQLDLVQVQVAAKYLTGQAVTWGEGDWDGAPGGTAGSPPPGDGSFNQLDIIAALAAGTYLTGPYAAVEANGQTGDPAQNLGGSFDHDVDGNIFKATFGGSFGSITFGDVAQSGLSEQFVLGDLSVVGSLAGGGDLAAVDLVYVPEPSTSGLLLFGLLLAVRCSRRR